MVSQYERTENGSGVAAANGERTEGAAEQLIYTDGMCVKEPDAILRARLVRWMEQRGFTEYIRKGPISGNPFLWVYPHSMKYSYGVSGVALGHVFCGVHFNSREFVQLWEQIENARCREAQKGVAQ